MLVDDMFDRNHDDILEQIKTRHRQAAQVRPQHPPARRSRRRRFQDAAARRGDRAQERPRQPEGHQAPVLRGHAGHADRPAARHVHRRARRHARRQGSAGALLRPRAHERRRHRLLPRAADHPHRRSVPELPRAGTRPDGRRARPGVPIYVDYVAGRQLHGVDEDARRRAEARLRHGHSRPRSGRDQGRPGAVQVRPRDDANAPGRR